MLGRRPPLTPLAQAVQGFPVPALVLLLGLALVVRIARRVQELVLVMTSLTTERAVPVPGSVRGIFEDLNALFCVYCEPCPSSD